jgi:hypothetical protein
MALHERAAGLLQDEAYSKGYEEVDQENGTRNHFVGASDVLMVAVS